MVYYRGDLETCYFLGSAEGREEVIIELDEIIESKNMYTNPAYKRLSLVDRYAPRIAGDMLAKLEWRNNSNV